MEKYKVAWILGLVFMLFIGFMIALVNINSTGYYQKQNYNNLPSMQSYETPKPAPIQHYEEARDESVKATETVNVVDKLPENSSIFSSFNNNEMLIFESDGSPDILAMGMFSGFLVLNLWFMNSIFGRRLSMVKVIVAFVMTCFMISMFSNVFG